MPIMKAGDGTASRSHFHRSLPNSFHAQTEDIRSQSEDVLMAMNTLCRSSALLAETFMGVFQDTPFMELALRLKQVSQDLAARTLNASEHIQEDGIAMVTRLIGRGSKEKTDEGVQVLARCFLLMLQTQCHFFRSATDVFAPLGQYEEVEDVLIGERCEDEGIREACSTWIAASQATKALRTGVSLTFNERQLLDDALHRPGHQGEAKVLEVKQKLDIQSSIYKRGLSELPRTEHTLTGGFHLQPQCAALLLHGCCSNAETTELLNSQSNKLLLHAMPGEASQQSQKRLSGEELRALLQADLRDVSLQVEGSPCHTSANQEENFKSKLQVVEKMVKETSKQLGVGAHKEQVALGLLCEASPSVAENQSRLAAQLIFGRADMVRIKPSNLHGNLQKYAQISSQEGVFTVEVPTVWKLDPIHRLRSAAGQETSLGVVEVVYIRQIELTALVEGRNPPLPTIKVKLRQADRTSTAFPTPQGSVRSPGDSSPGSPLGKGFRHTMEKLASKFGLGSAPVPRAASSEFYVSVDTVPDQQAELTNHRPNGATNVQSKVKEEPPAQHKGPVSCSTPKREVAKDTGSTAMPRPTMISPTVTITSHPSPTEEKVPWNKNIVGYKGPAGTKKGFASDAEVQDVVDLLSGVTRPPQSVIGQRLDSFGQSQRSTQNTTPSSSSSSGSNRSAVGGAWPAGGGGGGIDPNPAKYGNFNPTFQEAEAQDKMGEIPATTNSMVAVSRAWSNQPGPQHHPVQPLHRPIVSMYDNSSTDEEFAKYIATNFLGKRTKGYAKDLNMVGDQWGYPDNRLNQTWPPPPEGTSESAVEHLSHSFSGQHDSGSSSDESGENGDMAFSMGLGLTGPNFVASVNRRRHSSGGEEVIHHGRSFDPTGQAAVKYLEVAQMEPKSTKTWPPKVLWQRPVSPNDGATPTPGPYPLPPQEQLLVHPPLTPQWSDPVTLRQPPMWPPTGGSTPVSPAGSLSRLAPMQQPVQQGVPGGAAMGGMGGVQGGAGMARAHPKLDRKYAYSQY